MCVLPQFAIGPVYKTLYFYQYPLMRTAPDFFYVIVGDYLKPEAAPLHLDQSGADLDAQSHWCRGKMCYVK